MQPHKIVSREEWIEARKAHLVHEKEFTRARDRLNEERRGILQRVAAEGTVYGR